ncbi:hypothetical protein HJG60_011379 [Phyllostomus discolor]|uniref:Uncharacterized protein n=1 Tax=Phyllostomus discolor TaxID=89673 RepID=A0A834E5F6_9CHIR|nr:hypothetical protein HJG60_011379 [Phyllostomus discolor]
MGLSTEQRRPNSAAAAMMGRCSAAARLLCSCSPGEAGVGCSPPNSAARDQLPLPPAGAAKGLRSGPNSLQCNSSFEGGRKKPREPERREATGKHCNGGAWSRQQEKDATSSRMQHAIPGRRSPAPSPLATPPPFQITTLEPLY